MPKRPKRIKRGEVGPAEITAAEAEQKRRARSMPRFEDGTILTQPCFATDRYGVAWWINPQARTYSRVEPPATPAEA